MAFSVVVCKWCLLAVLLSSCTVAGSVDLTTVVSSSPSSTSRALCASNESPGVCLFKGLLKNALLYASRRYGAATSANASDKVGGEVDDVALQQSKGIEEYLLEQIQNLLGMFSFGFELPTEVTTPWTLLKSSFLNGRGKKNKNLGPMMAAGVAVMAGTLLPLAFGALFMLAGKAIMTSLMAITISGLLGLKTLFGKQESGHVKAYSAAPQAHYSEAQFEQELGIYKGQTEAKMHSSASNYYGGDSGSYYKGEQPLGNGSNPPEYYASGTGVSPKFNAVNHNSDSHHVESNKIVSDKNE